MEKEASYDLVVIGAGPGGYVAAIRAAQMGLSVALVEKEDIGGVCLNRGCIPSKALIHNAEVVSLVRRAEEFGISFENLKLDFSVAVRRSREAVERLTRGVELLLKKHNVALFYGTGSLKSVGTVDIDGEGGAKEIGAKNIILATGSRVTPLPGVPVDGTGIITSDEALRLTDLPGSLLVIGGGAVGVEFAYIFSAYGVKVTIAEMEPRLLPKEDEEIGDALTRAYSKQKISVKTGCRVNGIQKEYGRYSVTLATGKKEETLPFERILVATGRTPNSENLGLEAPGVKTQKGFIEVDAYLRSSVAGIYAIGDLAGKSLLAHSAMAEGITAVEMISGANPPPMNYRMIPSCTYGQPQVGSVGLTERAAREAGVPVKIGKFRSIFRR